MFMALPTVTPKSENLLRRNQKLATSEDFS